MIQRFIRITLGSLLTLLVISFLTFLLMKVIPGGPFDGDKALPPEVQAALEAKFRLNLPWYTQYYLYLKDLFLNLDMGPSIKYLGRNVTDIIKDSLPISLELGFYSLVFSIVLGLSMGLLAAVNRGKFWDYSAMFIAISGVSLPSFLVAVFAILLFSSTLGWFPAALWDSPAHKILPTIVLGLRPAALIARMTRSSILETLPLDFVKTARAKGLTPLTVLWKHVLRNSWIPIVTLLGPLSASILTGSFVIEYVFSIPGIASHYIQAVTNRDYPLILGVTLVFAFFLVVANSLVEISYTILDPRMRKEASK